LALRRRAQGIPESTHSRKHKASPKTQIGSQARPSSVHPIYLLFFGGFEVDVPPPDELLLPLR